MAAVEAGRVGREGGERVAVVAMLGEFLGEALAVT